MPRTYLSILAVEKEILDHFDNLFRDTPFFMGYVGSKNIELREFITGKVEHKHLLFVKPSLNFMTVSSPENLKKLGEVDVMILGTSLPNELIGFLQEYNAVGFIKPSELNTITMDQIISDINKKGYSANYHIPEEYWINKPPHVFPRPKPKLTKGENEVLKLLCHNYSVRQIADLHDISESAIRSHILNLKEKLHAESLSEVIVISMANSWVKIDRSFTASKSPFLHG